MTAKYADIADLPEDKRIELIGDVVITGKVVVFIVDTEGDDGQAKADRYIAKLKAMFPSLKVVERFDGPVFDKRTKKPTTVSVKVSL